MGYLIDTSVLIAVERSLMRDVELQARVVDNAAAISAITASELLHGAHRANTAQRRARREAFAARIFAVFPVLPVDLEVSAAHARIWSDLAAAGTLIGAHDMLIAATAVHHRLTIATRNPRDFTRVDGLVIEVW